MSSAVTPPPRKRPRRVSRSSPPRPFALLDQAEVDETCKRVVVQHGFDVGGHGRLVEPQAEQELPQVRLLVDRLDLARRRLSGRERRDVAGKARQVPTPLTRDRRDGSDSEPEVVATLPVAEVVAHAEVAAVLEQKFAVSYQR